MLFAPRGPATAVTTPGRGFMDEREAELAAPRRRSPLAHRREQRESRRECARQQRGG